MRHQDARQRLKQKPAHARMLKRNLVTSLLLYESVRTTRLRARAVQPIVDRLITIAKKGPAHVAIRRMNQVVTDRNASRKIMEVFVQRYANRASGLTHIVPVGARSGDGAELVVFSLVDAVVGGAVGEEKGAKKAKQTTKATKEKKETGETKEKKKKSSASSMASKAAKKSPAPKKKE